MIFVNSTNDPGHPCVIKQRHRIGVLRSAMHEMHGQAVDRGRELFELVEPPLLRAPVEPLPPVADQPTQVTDVGSMRPPSRLAAARGIAPPPAGP